MKIKNLCGFYPNILIIFNKFHKLQVQNTNNCLGWPQLFLDDCFIVHWFLMIGERERQRESVALLSTTWHAQLFSGLNLFLYYKPIEEMFLQVGSHFFFTLAIPVRVMSCAPCAVCNNEANLQNCHQMVQAGHRSSKSLLSLLLLRRHSNPLRRLTATRRQHRERPRHSTRLQLPNPLLSRFNLHPCLCACVCVCL